MKCVKKDDIYVYVKSNRMYFTIGNVEYEWIGDTNHAFTSRENIEQGHVRMIGNVLFYASIVIHSKWPRKNYINWDLVEHFDSWEDKNKYVKAFKKGLFIF